MRHVIGRVLILLAAAASAPRPSSAALFSTFNLQQDLHSSYLIPPSTVLQTDSPVTDTGVPYHQTIAVDSGHGGTATATYDVYDNGLTAGLSIYQSGSITALQNTVSESHTRQDTTFTFSQPVICSLSIYLGTTSGYVTSRLLFNDITQNGYGVAPNYNVEYDYSALLLPNSPYDLDEYWILSNQGASNQYANVSSTESIVFTFTAVPEPASVGLAASVILFLNRRTKRSR